MFIQLETSDKFLFVALPEKNVTLGFCPVGVCLSIKSYVYVSGHSATPKSTNATAT